MSHRAVFAEESLDGDHGFVRSRRAGQDGFGIEVELEKVESGGHITMPPHRLEIQSHC